MTDMDVLTLPLDYSAIERILPHRYPFLLVDRITEFEPDRRIVGGSTRRPEGAGDRYGSLAEMFLMPTMRLSSSSSVMRSTSRNG